MIIGCFEILRAFYSKLSMPHTEEYLSPHPLLCLLHAFQTPWWALHNDNRTVEDHEFHSSSEVSSIYI